MKTYITLEDCHYEGAAYMNGYCCLLLQIICVAGRLYLHPRASFLKAMNRSEYSFINYMHYFCGILASIITYRQLSVFLLFTALLVQSFNRVLVVGDYYINTKRYAINCENKAVEEMHCNGKCQMTKKLKQEDEKDKKNPQRTIENHNEFFLFDYLSPSLSVSVFFGNKQAFPLLQDPQTMDRPHSIFKPPTV